MVSHPVCGGAVEDGGDSGVRHAAAPSADALQWTGGEQQVESIVCLCVSSSAPSAGSALLVLRLVEVLRLQLKAEGGVYDDDAAGEGTHQARLVSFVSEWKVKISCLSQFLLGCCQAPPPSKAAP